MENTYKIQAAGRTDPGPVRHENEDAVFWDIAPSSTGGCRGIFAVADGVGGLSEGSRASRTLIGSVSEIWEQHLRDSEQCMDDALYRLLGALEQANRILTQYAAAHRTRLATTASVLLINQTHYGILHVGDSRIYQSRPSFGKYRRLEQLTTDHTCMVNREYNGTAIQKNVLTESIGGKETFCHNCGTGSLRQQDLFLLCSDGLYKTLESKRILAEVDNHRDSMESLCTALLHQAVLHGEEDNISVIAVKITK